MPKTPRSTPQPLLGSPLRTEGAPPPPVRANDPLINATVHGKFFVERDLGKGGSGRVYVALQLALNRRVALKVLSPEVDSEGDERFAERFFREASLAGALQHPNVVTVHDYGQTPEGICYIAMELLDGRSLKDLMKDGPLEPERALSIFEQVARGLRAAHRAGLVHRDVKPGNVLVIPGEDGVEVAKLLDFGLVKSDAPEVTEITRDGSFLGTPHYAAPEQVRGEEADARSDIYAFGVMLYRALTGKLPYNSNSAMAIALSHVRDPIPPMVERAPEVPVEAALEAVVRRCMAKDRADRYPDMDALLADLSRARRVVTAPLSAAPPPLPPPSPEPTPTPAPAPRRGLAALMLGGGLLAGAAGLGLLGLAYRFSGDGAVAALDAPVELAAPAEGAELLPAAQPSDPVLAEDSVTVTVLSDPAGAVVWADGQEVGRTPFAGSLPLIGGAPPPVRLEREGFRPADIDWQPRDGGLEASVSLLAVPSAVAPSPAPSAAPDPGPAPAPAAEPAPRPRAASTPAPSPAPAPAPAPAPRPSPAPSSGGAVSVDGVPFSAAQVGPALRFVNEASKEQLVAAGIAGAQAGYVLKGRPYADLAAFGAAYGVGPKTVEAVKRAAGG